VNNHPVDGEYSMSEIWQKETALALILLVVCLTLFFFRLGGIPSTGTKGYTL
jgi:hypothetical protein